MLHSNHNQFIFFLLLEYIKPICLPVGAMLKSENYDEVDLDVAGWGKTENGKPLINREYP